MATGDQSDMVTRLQSLLPRTWFQDSPPVLLAILNGIGNVLAAVYTQIQVTRLQTRIATSTGGFLDISAVDFFGTSLQRQVNETDAAFAARIKANLFRPKVTRANISAAVQSLTGRVPKIFEPANPTDTGGYGGAGVSAGTGMGYGIAGGYGSLALPFQYFITAYRPEGQGVANVAGYYAGSGWAGGGYGSGAIEYVNPTMFAGQVTDAAIQDVVSNTTAAGVIAWMNISS